MRSLQRKEDRRGTFEKQLKINNTWMYSLSIKDAEMCVVSTQAFLASQILTCALKGAEVSQGRDMPHDGHT